MNKEKIFKNYYFQDLEMLAAVHKRKMCGYTLHEFNYIYFKTQNKETFSNTSDI